MAKNDYKATSIKDRYKSLVKRNTLTKVTVSSDEKRTRAELLDMIEDMFETKNANITAEKLRAFFHILVKSVENKSDDVLNLNNATTVSSLPTREPRTAGLLWNDGGTVKVS
jgi:inorganic pyrophosphatase/exopolyphosphatase